MRIDKYQREYIKQLTSSRGSAKEVFEFLRDLIEREQDRKNISHVQYLRLQDLCILLDDQAKATGGAE